MQNYVKLFALSIVATLALSVSASAADFDEACVPGGVTISTATQVGNVWVVRNAPISTAEFTSVTPGSEIVVSASHFTGNQHTVVVTALPTVITSPSPINFVNTPGQSKSATMTASAVGVAEFRVHLANITGGGANSIQRENYSLTCVQNQRPIADAGSNQTVGSADVVMLDGTGSTDPENRSLSYAWTQISGPTTGTLAVSLDDQTSSAPVFTAPTLSVGAADVTYSFSLVVTDSGLTGTTARYTSTASTVTITVNAPANTLPVADAGQPQAVGSAASVTLGGSFTDPDPSQTHTYAWTAPAGAPALSSNTSAAPTFTAPTLIAGDPAQAFNYSLIVTDNLGGTSTASTVTITVNAQPSVVLSGAPAVISNTTPFTIAATFSEGVAGFGVNPADVLSDIAITSGSVTGITGGPSVYSLTITPTGAGDMNIAVNGNAAISITTGIGNAASNAVMVDNTIVEDTQRAIAGFMLSRANNLASNQPGLTRFLQGDGCGAFSANATEGSGAINGCVSQGNTWASLTSSWSGGDSYTLGTIGAHATVNPNLLIGGVFQYDRAEDSANNASGTGYMIGPYFIAKLPEQPLFLEGRLLYGQTDNNISPLGTYTDSFETERWLAQMRATGEYQYQSTTLMPLLDFTYTDDTQKAYTDSLGNTIPGQTVSLMQLTAGMDFSTPIPVATGALELTGGLSGIYSASDSAAAAPEFENWRGRTHLGLNYDTGTGATVNVGAFYDGIGTKYESYGANVGLDWKF